MLTKNLLKKKNFKHNMLGINILQNLIKLFWKHILLYLSKFIFNWKLYFYFSHYLIFFNYKFFILILFNLWICLIKLIFYTKIIWVKKNIVDNIKFKNIFFLLKSDYQKKIKCSKLENFSIFKKTKSFFDFFLKVIKNEF